MRRKGRGSYKTLPVRVVRLELRREGGLSLTVPIDRKNEKKATKRGNVKSTFFLSSALVRRRETFQPSRRPMQVRDHYMPPGRPNKSLNSQLTISFLLVAGTWKAAVAKHALFYRTMVLCSTTANLLLSCFQTWGGKGKKNGLLLIQVGQVLYGIGWGGLNRRFLCQGDEWCVS